MTVNIGSMHYASPEQHKCNKISYPTDIYSFGCIIDYLFNTMKVKNLMQDIQKLGKECTNDDQQMRPEINKIKSVVTNEILSFIHYEKCLLNENIDMLIMKQFIYENVLIVLDSFKLDKCISIIYDLCRKQSWITL